MKNFLLRSIIAIVLAVVLLGGVGLLVQNKLLIPGLTLAQRDPPEPPVFQEPVEVLDHLVCYPIIANEKAEEFRIEYKNQLEGNEVLIGPAEYFCVPTKKLAVDGEPVGCVDPTLDPTQGACTLISDIQELGIPQCCRPPRAPGVSCGPNEEWVIGIAAWPECYIPGS